MGTALTSSGSVVEGVPTRALPWIPHRGAVRRLGGGYRLGGRKDGCHLVLPVKTGIHGGVTAVGTALTSSGSVVEGVPTRAPPWVPHRGAVRRGRGVTAVGTALTSSGSVVEGVPTLAPPWVPHRGAVRRLGGGYRLGGRKDGGGCGCSCFARVCGRGRECIYRKKGLERGDGRGRWMAGWLGWPETRAGGDGGRGDGGRGDGGRRGWADSRVHACSLIC